MIPSVLLQVILLSLLALLPTKAPANESGDRPNILLIVADDLGFSDLPSYGGEIPTPNISALAQVGARFNHFYTSPSCSVTRAMLLTGVDNHLAGLGNMRELSTPQQRLQKGYEGYLNNHVVTVASLLRDAGYQTYMSGKWHLGEQPGQLPAERGFARSFALLQGAGNHFNALGYTSRVANVTYVDGRSEIKLPNDFYSSIEYTDRLMQFLSDSDPDAPFFAYLAYTAPHWPLQAPSEEIVRHRHRYQQGWDVIRRARFDRATKLGFQADSADPPPRWSHVPEWQQLDDATRQQQIEVMATYAAMITVMDAQIGRLINLLRHRDQLDNTLIVLLSDNGPEGRDIRGFAQFKDWIDVNYDSAAPVGSAQSFVFQGPGWAQDSATPLRGAKASTADGGIRSPLIVRPPAGRAPPASVSMVSDVRDLTATILDYAQVAHPGNTYGGRTVVPIEGVSLRPTLSLTASVSKKGHNQSRAVIGVEANRQSALIQWPWKLLRLTPKKAVGQWELYRLDQDPSESKNLATSNRAELHRLLKAYDQYVQRVGVTQAR